MITKETEAARFNEGKVRFSLIDFSMFSDMPMNFSIITNIETKEECIAKIMNLVSSIIFIDDQKYIAKILPEVQALTYRLSLFTLDIEFYGGWAFDLRAFESMARVLEYGCLKYDKNNWRKGYIDKFSSADSLYRHLRQVIIGEELDAESGLPHIGHIMCNIMFLTNDLLYVKRN